MKRTGIAGGICGVYAINTPCGKSYVGSSRDVRRRWYEHHWRMKNGKCSSPRLQKAFDQYGLGLKYTILETCAVHELRHCEQRYLDEMQPELNAVLDAWFAIRGLPNKRQKKVACDWARAMRKRRVPVEADDGMRFPSLHAAAAYFSTHPGHIHRLAKSQNRSKAGFRVRFASEPWRPEVTLEQRLKAAYASCSRTKTGRKMSADAKRKKSDALKGRPWSSARRAAYAKGQEKLRAKRFGAS